VCLYRGLDDLEQASLHSVQEDPAERLARKRAVKESLERLNRDQREVIELTHFEGMSQTEIAQKLSKPLGTVKSLVRSALKVLRTAAKGGVDDVRIL
jgi:RNA polymerase sigma-70 factor, ECF subfamily